MRQKRRSLRSLRDRFSQLALTEGIEETPLHVPKTLPRQLIASFGSHSCLCPRQPLQELRPAVRCYRCGLSTAEGRDGHGRSEAESPASQRAPPTAPAAVRSQTSSGWRAAPGRLRALIRSGWRQARHVLPAVTPRAGRPSANPVAQVPAERAVPPGAAGQSLPPAEEGLPPGAGSGSLMRAGGWVSARRRFGPRSRRRRLLPRAPPPAVLPPPAPRPGPAPLLRSPPPGIRRRRGPGGGGGAARGPGASGKPGGGERPRRPAETPAPAPLLPVEVRPEGGGGCDRWARGAAGPICGGRGMAEPGTAGPSRAAPRAPGRRPEPPSSYPRRLPGEREEEEEEEEGKEEAAAGSGPGWRRDRARRRARPPRRRRGSRGSAAVRPAGCRGRAGRRHRDAAVTPSRGARLERGGRCQPLTGSCAPKRWRGCVGAVRVTERRRSRRTERVLHLAFSCCWAFAGRCRQVVFTLSFSLCRCSKLLRSFAHCLDRCVLAKQCCTRFLRGR